VTDEATKLENAGYGLWAGKARLALSTSTSLKYILATIESDWSLKRV